ncbi:hypothetical protein C8J57DRAFT_1498254 [Mycena rebaudengoi]|nr:hypothetical protein C8J57DRAFT_1498254 [Mycena rebaudengoi]
MVQLGFPPYFLPPPPQSPRARVARERGCSYPQPSPQCTLCPFIPLPSSAYERGCSYLQPSPQSTLCPLPAAAASERAREGVRTHSLRLSARCVHFAAAAAASVPAREDVRTRSHRLSARCVHFVAAASVPARKGRLLLGLSALFLASAPLIRPPRPLLGLSAIYQPQRLILGLRAFFSASAPTASAPYTRPQRSLLGLSALLSAMMGFLPPPLCPRGCSYQRPSQFSAASLAREGARNRSFCLSARCVRAPYMSLLLRPEASNSFAPYIVRDKHHPFLISRLDRLIEVFEFTSSSTVAALQDSPGAYLSLLRNQCCLTKVLGGSSYLDTPLCFETTATSRLRS